MFTTINMTMADGSHKEMGFMSNGLTQYRYRQFTGRELMKDISKLVNVGDSSIGDDADFTCIDKLAYIMNMSATGANMNTLTEESFFNWIEQFDSSNSIQIWADIISAYYGTKKSTSEPKKEDGE
jgi:hypothetical protein